ncbi:hypothetical protein MJO29_002621 [Puccinia striiformis f. sp. tritici]|uniref:hypothetical protein n=1 Tax=Puccinia striiformis f. sp. tritici TaxID=168172 RepID=UPI002007493D|nr:hypothetical protein Pst134EA_005492 [Puccinia striiformis f. sp. tritici]KAH9471601.1 hypothetical protein Pst134EA_005492 [Puccinia striiformis f. sp. tritici]KAI7964523.1 hypothetical protein MJO29_002621 [Puccinia striiformis f. sp. tritici]
MPTNAVSGASCTIDLLNPTSTSTQSETWTTCTEYEYETTHDSLTGAPTETVTIESKQSCRFKVTYCIHPTACDLLKTKINTRQKAQGSLRVNDYAVQVLLDGVPIVTSTQLRSRKPGPHGVVGICDGKNTYRDLQFAPANLVDPDDSTNQICEDESIISSLGTIEVRVYKCRLSRQKKIRAYMTTATTNDMSFSENIKKTGLSTTAGLGKPNTKQASQKLRYDVTPSDPHPFLQFIFRYKPRPVLIAEGVIPPPDEPVEPPAAPSAAPPAAPPVEQPAEPPTEGARIPKGSDSQNIISIDSDSESEKEKEDTKPQKDELDEKPVKKEHTEDQKKPEVNGAGGSGCCCNCQKRVIKDEGSESGNPHKRPRVSSDTQDVKPAKPVFIDLTL